MSESGANDRLRQMVGVCVMVSGLLNVGAIVMQGVELLHAKDSTGLSATAFFLWLFIQVSYCANGILHKDRWQTFGMALSFLANVWVIILIFSYR